MCVQNISTSNITTYVNELMQGTFTMHTSQLLTILLTVSPSLSHILNSMNLRHVWACRITFKLEGGCWNSYWNPIEQVGMVTHSISIILFSVKGLWVHVDTDLLLSRLTPTLSTTEVSIFKLLRNLL